MVWILFSGTNKGYFIWSASGLDDLKIRSSSYLGYKIGFLAFLSPLLLVRLWQRLSGLKNV